MRSHKSREINYNGMNNILFPLTGVIIIKEGGRIRDKGEKMCVCVFFRYVFPSYVHHIHDGNLFSASRHPKLI